MKHWRPLPDDPTKTHSCDSCNFDKICLQVELTTEDVWNETGVMWNFSPRPEKDMPTQGNAGTSKRSFSRRMVSGASSGLGASGA